MPWWSWIWVVAMLAMTLGGAGMDLRDREPPWYTALGLASGIACVIFVLNFFHVIRLRNLAPLAAVTLVALVYEAWRDVRADPELTAAQKILAVVLTVALFVPATVLGMLGPEG